MKKHQCNHPVDGEMISRPVDPEACIWHIERKDEFCTTECEPGWKIKVKGEKNGQATLGDGVC